MGFTGLTRTEALTSFQSLPRAVPRFENCFQRHHRLSAHDLWRFTTWGASLILGGRFEATLKWSQLMTRALII